MRNQTIHIPARGAFWRGPALLGLLAITFSAFGSSIVVFGTLAIVRSLGESLLTLVGMFFGFLISSFIVLGLALAAWRWAFRSAFVQTTLEFENDELVIHRKWRRSKTVRLPKASIQSLLVTDLFHPKICLEVLALLSNGRTVQICTGPSGEEFLAVVEEIEDAIAGAPPPN